MADYKAGYVLGATPRPETDPPRRARITRPLSSEELAAAMLAKEPRGLADPPPRPPAGAEAEPSRTTQQLGTADLGPSLDEPPVVRPVQVIIEPSYVPLAPGRPDTIEVLLPAGIVQLKPWQGARREVQLARPEALQLHRLALHAMSVPTNSPPSGLLDVIPMVVIMRYEGFAHRWNIIGPGRTALDQLVAALAAVAGYDIRY